MGLNVGSPYIPPDNVLLSVNGTTGALEFKPATRGDILYAGASGVWSKLAKGTSGQYLQIGANDPAWSAPPGEGWTYLEKITFAGESTKTSGTLTVYDEYLVRSDDLVKTGTDIAAFRVNGITSTSYTNKWISGTTVTASTTEYFIYRGGAAQSKIPFAIVLTGKSPTIANGCITMRANSSQGNATQLGLCGSVVVGSAVQLSTVTFFSGSDTFVGTIEIYGRMRN